jgi:hypothetical protein
MSAVLGIVRGHRGGIKVGSEVDKGLAGFLQKPFNMDELREKLMAIKVADR